MRKLRHLFEKNRTWSEKKKQEDPDFFNKLSEQQTPKYLWIGCSDSRIPANEILGAEPGEIFVHRNIANLFPHTDFNCLSVLQFAVDFLRVEDIIVCGHYGCAGVAAAMEPAQHGLVDNWLRNIRDVYYRERKSLDIIDNQEEKYKRLTELNVIYQVMNICHTTIVQNAWGKGQELSIHGWIYDLSTGLLQDLSCCISSLDQVEEIYRMIH